MYLYICVCTSIYIYVYVCVRMHIYMCVYVYMCIYIFLDVSDERVTMEHTSVKRTHMPQCGGGSCQDYSPRLMQGDN